MGATRPLEIVADLDRAAAMLDPTRLRLLSELAEPDSASGLARRLGMPRQRVNYHLKELEKAGLVEPVEERRKGNCVEKVVRATAASYLLNPSILGPLAPGAAASPAGGPSSGLWHQIQIAFATPGDRASFIEDVVHEISRLAAEYRADPAQGTDPAGGGSFRLYIAGCQTGPGE